MLTDSIGKVIVKLVLPSVLSMMFSTVHMLICWFLVRKDITVPVSEVTDTLSLLAIASPLEQLLYRTFPALVGAGTSVLVSRLVGEGLFQDCSHVAGNALVLQLVLSLFSILIYPKTLYLVCSPFFSSTSIQIILPYLRALLWGSPIAFLSTSINALMRGQGAAGPQCHISILSTFCHLLLDIYFIHFRKEGFVGLAYASTAASLVSCALSLLYLGSDRSVVRFSKSGYRLRWRLCKQIFIAGVPGLVSTVCPSIMSLFRTRLLMYLLHDKPVQEIDMAISVFNSVQTTYFIGFMPLIALTQGVGPIFAYAYGAKKNKRFRECGKVLFRIQCVWVGIAVVGLFASSHWLALWFSSDPVYCSSFESSLKIFSSSLLVYPIIMTLFPVLQTTGHGALAGLLLAMNECVVIIPLQILFGVYWKENPYMGFIVAYPVNAVCCMLIALIVGWKSLRSIFYSQSLYRESISSVELSWIVGCNKQ